MRVGVLALQGAFREHVRVAYDVVREFLSVAV